MIHIFNSPENLAKAFADKLLEVLRGHEGSFHLALSGGSTPKLLFALWAEHYREAYPWDKIHFWWGDERCVPPDHAESNFGMTRDILFSKIKLPITNIHRVLGENDPEGEALRYGEEINQFLPQKGGWPVFDLMMLGMGSDGHTASIFPNGMELLDSKSVCEVATHPESGQKRVTLTGAPIRNSNDISFLVTGSSKAEKILSILDGQPGADAFPAAHVLPFHGELNWYVDEAANSLRDK